MKSKIYTEDLIDFVDASSLPIKHFLNPYSIKLTLMILAILSTINSKISNETSNSI